MKVIVISNLQGKIISITKLIDIGAQPSGIVNAGVLPKKDQRVDYIDLPPKLSKESSFKIHTNYHVKLKKARPVLVSNDLLNKAKRKK